MSLLAPANGDNLGPQDCEKVLLSVLRGKIDIDPIRALDEQIREHERALIRLKRTRNSLLSVSKLPPEVLGDIFHRNTRFKDKFGGLEKESHNFLFVCRHWFEVASRTPELWSFWGNTPEDWGRWCRRSGTTPLDLVLDVEDDYTPFDATLFKVLQDRATRDTIRRIHLRAEDSGLLSSIISHLTITCDGIGSNSVASFILYNWDYAPVDVSSFFAQCSFPKLQRLVLRNCMISSWDCLMSRTTVLTTLSLRLADPSPTPSISQLLSILASNPALRKVVLLGHAAPDDDGGKSSLRVQLHHLEKLELDGDFQHVFGLLDRLDHPNNMKRMRLTLNNCDIMDISRIVGPYLRDYIQRRDRSQSGLFLSLSSWRHLVLHLGNVGGIDLSVPGWAWEHSFVHISISLRVAHSSDILKRTSHDLIARVPQEEVIHLHANRRTAAMEDAYAQFPNLRTLSSYEIPLSEVFPNLNRVWDEKISPSLDRVRLERTVVHDGDWSPLVTFLVRRASSGNQLGTLTIVGSSHMCSEVVESIRGMVRVLEIDHQDSLCPFGTCPVP